MVTAYLASVSAHMAFDAFCLTYSDPTGEAAVQNVMAGAN
jgi:hypothetical protein